MLLYSIILLYIMSCSTNICLCNKLCASLQTNYILVHMPKQSTVIDFGNIVLYLFIHKSVTFHSVELAANFAGRENYCDHGANRWHYYTERKLNGLSKMSLVATLSYKKVDKNCNIGLCTPVCVCVCHGGLSVTSALEMQSRKWR